MVARTDAGSAEAYLALEGGALFGHWKVAPDVVRAIFTRLDSGPASIAELRGVANLGISLAVEVVARLVKMNLVRPV